MSKLGSWRPAGLSWRLAAVFLVVVVLGGSNAVAVRFSNVELPPFWGASLRFGAAAAVFWLIIGLRRIPLPRGRALWGSALFGALSTGVFYALVYWALLSVTASLTMVVLALGPLLTFFFAWAHGQESFRWRGLLGAVIAFAGIAMGVAGEIGTAIPLLPLLALFGGAAVVSEATVLLKSFPRSDPLVVNAVALTTGTAMLVALSLVVGETWALPATGRTWLSFGYLVLGGSVTLFYLYLYLLQRWTASATSYAFLLFPVATIIIASLLADEAVTPRFLVGAAIILAGVWLGTIASPRMMRPRRVPAALEPES